MGSRKVQRAVAPKGFFPLSEAASDTGASEGELVSLARADRFVEIHQLSTAGFVGRAVRTNQYRRWRKRTLSAALRADLPTPFARDAQPADKHTPPQHEPEPTLVHDTVGVKRVRDIVAALIEQHPTVPVIRTEWFNADGSLSARVGLVPYVDGGVALVVQEPAERTLTCTHFDAPGWNPVSAEIGAAELMAARRSYSAASETWRALGGAAVARADFHKARVHDAMDAVWDARQLLHIIGREAPVKWNTPPEDTGAATARTWGYVLPEEMSPAAEGNSNG